jgi:uncharacterized protein YbbC (DUF1343 family)
MTIRVGLEQLVDTPGMLSGVRVGFCCNHTAVNRELRHGIDLLTAQGVNVVRLFGPEHGVRATAQDMEGVSGRIDPVSGIECISLYGSSEASLRPTKDQLSDLDVILFDIQDIGTRYYTYQATLGYMMEVAGEVGTKVVVLDRPNPINGVSVEGNMVLPGFDSFVGAYPIANRHGMTVGELGHYFKRYCGVECDYEVIEVNGWRRSMWFDETGLPWVFPSPNMPTLETATIYPGMCLLEATTLSEGRGTTRPFHLVGAPWVNPDRFVTACEREASRAGLRGVAFRPAVFVPGFQKHSGVSCGGLEVHITDRDQLDATLLGLVVVCAAYSLDSKAFGWREEPYEFIEDVPAIDLLTGSSAYRQALEQGTSIGDVYASWADPLSEFMARRESCLLY